MYTYIYNKYIYIMNHRIHKVNETNLAIVPGDTNLVFIIPVVDI
jgi:hypothetical protein